MEGSELFRHAEQWLTDNPTKNLSDYRKETGYSGPALKLKNRKNEPVRVSYKGKSSEAQTRRAVKEKPKTEGEAAYMRKVKQQARQQSQSTLHQYATGGKSSIAEHDVRLASSGTSEYMSVSDPDFKVFKDTVESKLPSGYVADIDDVTGGVRVIPEKYHNKFQRTSLQPGITLELGDDIAALNRNLGLLKKIKSVPRYGSIMGILPDIIEAIDIQTDGAIDKTVTDIGNRLGEGLQKVGGSILNTLKNTVPSGYDIIPPE
jgi:hypothetical protein